MILRITLFLIFGWAIVSCSSYKPTTTTQSKYTEDLSSLRPKNNNITTITTENSTEPERKTAYVEARYNINKNLDQVLDSINSQRLRKRYVDGYTIQVFNGEKDGALGAKRQLTINLPEINAEIKFEPPTFRVRAGRYLRPLDAQKDFVAIKKYFPSAILVPEKIALN